LRKFVDAIASANGLDKTSASVMHDLKQILRRAEYVICDKVLFSATPTNETDVHQRLEGILKCYFPDLKTKPRITKPIKNFEPDTGIPSKKTLIEYKFISSTTDAKRVTDEILADASGYKSREWSNLLYVIYESGRVVPAAEWEELLKECHLIDGFDAIVLSG
jgi:REase_DpnII-MboI